MKYSHQEGEIRPLYSSVPKNQCFWPWAVVGSYPLAYFYLRCILFGEVGRYRGWAMTAFAVVFLLAIEAAARVCRRTAARETPLWAACWLALSVTLAVPGHFYFLGLVQELAWHLLAIWCVLARFGMLAQGHTGVVGPAGCLGRVLHPAVWQLFCAGGYRFLRPARAGRAAHRGQKVAGGDGYAGADGGVVQLRRRPAGRRRCPLCRPGHLAYRDVAKFLERPPAE